MEQQPVIYPAVSPYLICSDAPALIAFMHAAFDGTLQRRFDRPDGSLMHAEVRIGDSIVMIGGGIREHGTATAHLHVYVPDARESYDRAIEAGASAVQEPQRKSADDDLRGGVMDFAGNTWWMASR